jgi:hypothetical protein
MTIKHELGTVVDQSKMGQSKFRLCNSIFLRNPSRRKQKCQKSVGIYFSLFVGINLRIKRSLQSEIHVRFPTLENQIQMNKFFRQFSKTPIISLNIVTVTR